MIAWGDLAGKWEKRLRNDAASARPTPSQRSIQDAVGKALKCLVSAEGAQPDMTESNGSVPAKIIYVTLTGLPLDIHLEWPFHKSTSGSDFWVLHADLRLPGHEGIHAPVSVNLSATVREVLPSLEPKDVLSPIINALRKEVDHRQLEFLKSGKLVPVNFSSRHYDFKRNQWVFGKASDETITTFLERKIFWQTKLVGGDVWLSDATEAQYLQTTTDHLAEIASHLAARGLIKLERRYATAQPSLTARSAEFEVAAETALAELEKKHAFERG
jgi:hypothetical protein